MATDATAIIAIPEALLETAATRHFEGTLDLAELAAGPDTYTFAAPVSWSVEATNTGDAILIQGTAAGDATTQCARCLEDVTYGLEGDIEGSFPIGGEEEAEMPEDMEGDEFDFLPDNRKIDLVPLIVAALLLEVPLVPLCDDDCKGLCPQCGANLNEGPCGCSRDEADVEASPFAALKNFDFGDTSKIRSITAFQRRAARRKRFAALRAMSAKGRLKLSRTVRMRGSEEACGERGIERAGAAPRGVRRGRRRRGGGGLGGAVPRCRLGLRSRLRP